MPEACMPHCPGAHSSAPSPGNRDPGDVISLEIRDTEDVSLVSEQIQLFCRGHKIDRKTGMKAALCFEELALNIIHFGFPKCKRNPCIGIRLVISENELIMRLRDNCPMFDVEWYIAHRIDASRDDGDIHIGLKMIGSLTENIKYVHSLENNNVIIRL